jgi:hypothetical protein
MNQNEYIDVVSPPPALCHPLSPEARKFFEYSLLGEQHELLGNRAAEILGKGVKEEDTTLMMMYLAKRFALSSASKAFAITSTGEMALVPPLARVGDLCVHIRGGYIPVVLRGPGHGEKIAELVGTCKVQGMVDAYSGEGWEDWFLE